MSFISKESPTGTINGVNKVFTLLNAPSQVDDVFMDGVIYTDYILSGSIITLVDAPTLSLWVDYYTGTVTNPVTTDVTFGDMKAKVWNLLGQTANSTTFSDSIVGDALNSMEKRVIRGRITSLLDSNRTYRVGKLWFMESRFSIRNNGGSILTVDYNVGDTTITCATDELLSAGYVEIGGEIIRYTSKSSTQLLGVSGATVNHLETEAIQQLFECPLDMEKPSSVEVIVKGKRIDKVYLPFLNSNYTNEWQSNYQLRRSRTLQLIRIQGIEDNTLLEVIYQKKVTDMTLNSDVCILPDDYGITVLAYLVAGQFAFEKGMPNAQPILLSAYSALQNMLQDFTSDTIITKQKITPKAYSNFR